MTTTEKIIKRYLNFNGERTYLDFLIFQKEVFQEMKKHPKGSYEYTCLEYIRKKLLRGMQLCEQYKRPIDIIIEDTIEDIERGYDLPGEQQYTVGKTKGAKKKRTAKKKTTNRKKGNELGKLVDHGDEIPEGNSDAYWGREGIDLVFLPNDEKVRKGDKIPSSYKYADIRFLEKYYGIKGFEFGNWLSQQDRVNYLSGLGLALFDLRGILDFAKEQIGLKRKLSVAFGARGRGKATAHFEPEAFVINLTRYSRPSKVNKRPLNFRRVNLILKDGGVGSFAHEYAHALDYFAGTYIEKAPTWQISGGRDTDPSIRFPSAKKPKLQGLMDNILNKILWKGKNVQSDYYKRLNKKGTDEYYLRRNEIWARSFEVYVHYRLEKQKQKNVFLNKSKYAQRYYLSFSEMKKIEKDVDSLLAEIKKHL